MIKKWTALDASTNAPRAGRGTKLAAEAGERLVASTAFKADGPEHLGTAGSIPVRLRHLRRCLLVVPNWFEAQC